MRFYFAFIGTLLLGLGFYLLYRRLILFKHSSLAEGTLKSYEARENDGTYYHLVVAFTSQDGNQYEFVSVAGSGSRPYPEGHRLRVRYNSLNPKEAFIDSFLHFWAGPLAFIVLGIGGFVAVLVK
jgi:Protein of unknown function (DUF3592)